MDTILTVLGGILGIAVPVLFVFALNKGISGGPFTDVQKALYRRNINVVTASWTIAVWVLSLSGAISYHTGDTWPRVVLPLVIPVVAALFLLLHPTS